MNRRVDNIMHKNTYNMDVNKKLNLQEDIEKLEEQLRALEEVIPELTKEVSTLEISNTALQKQHKHLIYKKSTDYDGWEEDLKSFEVEMEGVIVDLERWSSAIKQKIVMSGRASPYTNIYYMTSISDIFEKYPKLVVKSEELVKGSETLKKLKDLVDVIAPELESQLEEVNNTEACMKKKEEEYTKYLSEERKTGMWYFLGGCLVATVITLMLK